MFSYCAADLLASACVSGRASCAACKMGPAWHFLQGISSIQQSESVHTIHYAAPRMAEWNGAERVPQHLGCHPEHENPQLLPCRRVRCFRTKPDIQHIVPQH